MELKNKKSISIITSNLTDTGGLQMVTCHIANELYYRYDYEIEIINLGIKNGEEKYKLNKNIKISYIGVDSSKIANKVDLIKNLFEKYIKLKKYVRSKENRYGQIVIGMGTNASYLLPYVYKKNNILIGTQHNPVKHTKLSDLFRCITIKKLDKYVVLDNDTSNDMIKNCKIDNVEVIPNPLTLNAVSKCNQESKNVLAVGRLTKQKGFDLLIDSWKYVVENNPEWKLVIVGEGEEYNSLKMQIERNKLENSISIKPFTTKIYKYYENASIFALSSRFEGFGLVILEAQAFGLPVVAFDCPTGPRNIINNSKDGYLIEDGNIRAFSNKINELIDDKSLRIKIGEEAIKNSEKFKIENIIEKWNGLLESVTINK